MKEELLSVGIDLGTSTSQLVFSKLLIENIAGSFSVPKIVITKKEIQYKSEIYFTPLIDQHTIDFEKVKEIVEKEYKKAGIQKEDIDTGAVIITGETARKENAREVVNALSGFAGDFVVATAGPDLESVISGKGAGTDVYSKEHHMVVINMDIGGGTSNLAVFSNGDTVDTGCMDIGGRLIKIDPFTKKITYIAEKLKKIIEKEHLTLKVGELVDFSDLDFLLKILTEALEESVGLRENTPYYDLLITNHGIEKNHKVTGISFSGGVASIIYHEEHYTDVFQFGDIGILLAKAIKNSALVKELQVIESTETIRATVVGAGSHTTEISGSTITYTKEIFPIKNLPVLKIQPQEEQAQKLSHEILKKLEWFRIENEIPLLAISLEGEKNPKFSRIQEYATDLVSGTSYFGERNLPVIVVVKHDMAKVLGQTMYRMTNFQIPIICLDGISLSEGDYIDLGKPAAGGSVLPVVVKTLAFQQEKNS